jgi:hypothetical protein
VSLIPGDWNTGNREVPFRTEVDCTNIECISESLIFMTLDAVPVPPYIRHIIRFTSHVSFLMKPDLALSSASKAWLSFTWNPYISFKNPS